MVETDVVHYIRVQNVLSSNNVGKDFEKGSSS